MQVVTNVTPTWKWTSASLTIQLKWCDDPMRTSSGHAHGKMPVEACAKEGFRGNCGGAPANVCPYVAPCLAKLMLQQHQQQEQMHS